MKLFAATCCLCLLWTSTPASAQKPRLSGTGGGGTLLNLNGRMADGVSTTAVALTGAGELALPGLFPRWNVRAAAGLDLAFFAGTAFVGNVTLLVGVSRPFLFLSQTWEAGVTAGPALTVAPTRDAGSTWTSTVVKLDLRCDTCPLGAGVYVKLQQIWMSNVADPWMLGAGLEVRFDFSGRPAPIVMPEARRQTGGDGPVVKPVDDNDPDGDGVKGPTDLCPSSARGAKVEVNGCEAVADGMELDAGMFAAGSAALTATGEQECRRVVELLNQNAQLAIVFQVTAADEELANLRFMAISKKLQELGIPGRRVMSGTRAGTPESITLAFRLLL
ncbi:hypothetical protein KKD52_14080 [Myxococcota bacterium]|nr:hypothetical protein [Myxococcota bacterium]MBU1413564.1 hypothetical protein [Myxococcota bacterium]MBU1511483.1 hypothetical protein [Myxococcota bacterium]